MQIILRCLVRDDLPELRAWFEDVELSRRLSFPTDEWFAYVTAGAAARCRIALDAGRTIAVMQVDCEHSERGYLDLAVRPDGIGTAVLMAFLSGPGRAYPTLEGRIEADNAASLACCRRCGPLLGCEGDDTDQLSTLMAYFSVTMTQGRGHVPDGSIARLSPRC